MRLYVGLLHYPVFNKHRQPIVSAITTFDLHDIARVARTYGARRFFVVTPLADQQRLTQKIRQHWLEGFGARYNPHRREAMELVEIVSTLAEAEEAIAASEGERPLRIATDAAPQLDGGISFRALKTLLAEQRAVLLLFGTAWGLAPEFIRTCDFVLEPIYGPTAYNHLSVRSAAAIILDRLAASED